MNNKYTKDFLIKELAYRARFNQNDVKIIIDTLEEIIEDVVANGDELMIGGLFKIYVKEMKPHKAFDISTQKHKEIIKHRLVISPSTTLKKIAKECASEYSDEE